MRKRAQKIRLGLFVMIASVLLLVILGFFTAKQLFERTDNYYVAYRDVSVSGLEVGSPVKYMGINVGSISSIYIDPDDINQIIVRLSLRHGTPIKEDATADIVAMGITGLKTIEIRGGTNEAAYLQEEKFIQQGTSLVDDVSGRVEVIAYKVEEVLNNILDFTKPENLDKISRSFDLVADLAENANTTFVEVNQLVAENRDATRETINKASNIAGTLELTANDLQAAMGAFNNIMQGDTLSEVLGNLREISLSLRESNLQELIENLAFTVAQTQLLLVKLDADLDRGSKDISDNLTLLKHTLENLNEASRQINANPSVLIRGQRARDIPDRSLQ